MTNRIYVRKYASAFSHFNLAIFFCGIDKIYGATIASRDEYNNSIINELIINELIT